jgi:SAM-dependent methyltransferase
VRNFGARLLDVGCGRGDLLFRLADLGFQNLTGIDPYAPEELQRGPVRILKRPLESLADRSFDLVMFHHSFEHVPNPLEVLKATERVLASTGTCLIRLPIASKGPWRIYGTDWAEIDAPRHFFLHTEFSLSRIAAEAGLALVHLDYEAEPFSFAASEMYRRGLSLYSREENRSRSWWEPFSSDEVARFKGLAQEYNIPGWAGRAAFYFTHGAEAALGVGFAETR